MGEEDAQPSMMEILFLNSNATNVEFLLMFFPSSIKCNLIMCDTILLTMPPIDQSMLETCTLLTPINTAAVGAVMAGLFRTMVQTIAPS
jgi:hypothetical protein